MPSVLSYRPTQVAPFDRLRTSSNSSLRVMVARLPCRPRPAPTRLHCSCAMGCVSTLGKKR